MTEARVALVTGASRGIGKTTAIALAAVGFDVAVAARTLHAGDSDEGPGGLDVTAEAIEATGRRALPVRMDLLDRASVVAAATHVAATWGRIDVLVNNAVHTGAGSMERFEDLSVEMLEAKLEANVVAQFVLTKAVVPAMLDRGGGAIVNVTSAVAVSDPPAPTGEGGWGMGYAISKGGFHRMAGILAVEHGRGGLRAFNVDPGFVVTERMAARKRELGFEERYVGAPPSVPAAVIAWLATSAEEDVPNGTTVRAQKLALERGLHPDWRSTPSREEEMDG